MFCNLSLSSDQLIGGFHDPTCVTQAPPLRGWYSRDSLCYGVWVLVEYITANAKTKTAPLSARYIYRYRYKSFESDERAAAD